MTRRNVLAFTLGILLGLGIGIARPVTVESPQLVVHIESRPWHGGLPPLPDSVIGVRGWVKVERVAPPLMCGADEAWGCYTYAGRRMQIVTGIDRWKEWEVFEHEKVHLALGDARLVHGQRDDDADDIDDQIAEAIMRQRMLERLAR